MPPNINCQPAIRAEGIRQSWLRTATVPPPNAAAASRHRAMPSGALAMADRSWESNTPKPHMPSDRAAMRVLVSFSPRNQTPNRAVHRGMV